MYLPFLVPSLLCAAAVAGCGSGASDLPRLDVAAASSLASALEQAAPRFPGATVRLASGGSDLLAAQIRAGARPDVYAAANERLPRALYGERLVERPRAFARNELVLAVPAGGGPVRGIGDLSRAGVRIATGSVSVPVGSYTEQLLGRLPASRRAAIERHVRTREPDVVSVLAKVEQGAVDAGFVYRTDVLAAGGRVRALALPRALGPVVVYAAAVVRGTREPAAARRYVQSLIDGAAARALRRAGFRAP